MAQLTEQETQGLIDQGWLEDTKSELPGYIVIAEDIFDAVNEIAGGQGLSANNSFVGFATVDSDNAQNFLDYVGASYVDLDSGRVAVDLSNL